MMDFPHMVDTKCAMEFLFTLPKKKEATYERITKLANTSEHTKILKINIIAFTRETILFITYSLRFEWTNLVYNMLSDC